MFRQRRNEVMQSKDASIWCNTVLNNVRKAVNFLNVVHTINIVWLEIGFAFT